MAKKARLSFDKDLFKRSVVYNVKTLYRKSMEEATPQQIFQAVSYSIKDAIVDHWMTSQEEYEKQDPKVVYYLSMEFLMGRALGNNIINLQAFKPVKEALDELGVDLNVVEDQEPDPASETEALEDLQHVSWIPWLHWDIPLMAAASVTATACLSSRSGTDTR